MRRLRVIGGVVLRGAAAVAGLAALAFGGLAAWGATLPAGHEASGEAEIAASPERVYTRIADPAAYPSWRPSLTAVRPVADGRWIEEAKDGSMPYRFGRREPPRLLETVIDSESLPFGGTWTFELAPAPGGTRVRITERGTVRAAPMRAMARLFFPADATLKAYLADLKASFSPG